MASLHAAVEESSKGTDPVSQRLTVHQSFPQRLYITVIDHCKLKFGLGLQELYGLRNALLRWNACQDDQGYNSGHINADAISLVRQLLRHPRQPL